MTQRCSVIVTGPAAVFADQSGDALQDHSPAALGPDIRTRNPQRLAWFLLRRLGGDGRAAAGADEQARQDLGHLTHLGMSLARRKCFKATVYQLKLHAAKHRHTPSSIYI